ncbi:MAG: ChaB family protein [Nocardioidaceae bacterium]
MAKTGTAKATKKGSKSKDAKSAKSAKRKKDKKPDKGNNRKSKSTKGKGGSKANKLRADVAQTTTESGAPKVDELPSTLQRSGKKAQRTFATVHDAAAEQYDDAERVNRTAFAALKHTHEKVADHWEPKDESGPSDAKAAGGRNTDAETVGGVDANASKQHLYALAQRLEVPGRSRMSKPELVDALQKANDKATRQARGR